MGSTGRGEARCSEIPGELAVAHAGTGAAIIGEPASANRLVLSATHGQRRS
jgi:hypothetical protein